MGDGGARRVCMVCEGRLDTNYFGLSHVAAAAVMRMGNIRRREPRVTRHGGPCSSASPGARRTLYAVRCTLHSVRCTLYAARCSEIRASTSGAPVSSPGPGSQVPVWKSPPGDEGSSTRFAALPSLGPYTRLALRFAHRSQPFVDSTRALVHTRPPLPFAS